MSADSSSFTADRKGGEFPLREETGGRVSMALAKLVTALTVVTVFITVWLREEAALAK